MRMMIMVSVLAGTTAAAETQMDAPQLDALLTGNTVYLAVPDGEAPMHYGVDGRTSAVLPNGTKLVGSWRIGKGGYCVDWDNGPQNSCTKVVKSDDGTAMFDAASGDPRGTVTRIIPGNPEAF